MRTENSPVIDLSTVEAGRKVLAVFFRIAHAWALTETEQMTLLDVDERTLREWKVGQLRTGLGPATLERLSHLLAIYAALQVLLPIPERAHAWVRRTNTAPIFAGESALHRMLGGQIADLSIVRKYLDAQRGGWT